MIGALDAGADVVLRPVPRGESNAAFAALHTEQSGGLQVDGSGELAVLRGGAVQCSA